MFVTKKAFAATGVKVSGPNLDKAIAGMPIRVIGNEKPEKIVEDIKSEIEEEKGEVTKKIEEISNEIEKRMSNLKSEIEIKVETLTIQKVFEDIDDALENPNE